ncbi:MAG: hypothetical protein ABL932_10685 [Terricaulis sp.]
MSSFADHMSQAIEASQLVERPAPYIFTENVFPAAVYRELELLLDRSTSALKEQIHKGDPAKFFGSYRDRLEMRFGDGQHQDGIAEDDAARWEEFAKELRSTKVFSALFCKFESGFRGRFGADVDAEWLRGALRPTLLFTKHRAGYYLGPHTDRYEKVLTCVLNFAERDGLDHLGTTMYEPKEAGFTCQGIVHHNPDLFSPIGIAPYRPNSALFFFRDDRLFHGVERLTEESLQGSERPNVQFNLWAS